jgi:hypothetical protein
MRRSSSGGRRGASCALGRSHGDAIICSIREARTSPVRTGSSSVRPRAARASELTDNVTAFAESWRRRPSCRRSGYWPPVPLRTSGAAPSPRPSSRRRRSPSAGRQVIQRRTDGVVKLSKRRREADCCASNGRSDLAPRGHSRGAKHAVVWADMRWRWTLKML